MKRALQLLSASIVFVFAFAAHAQSSTDLQGAINALLAQIQTLQGKLAEQGAVTPEAQNYTRNLTVGSKGDDVTALQTFLKAGGYLTVAPTGYFGGLTKAALAKYQSANKISPASGYFGPKTRAAVSAVVVGQIPKPTPAPIAPPVVTAPPALPPPVVVTPTAPPALPNPFQSSLKILTTLRSYTLSTLSPALIYEFSISADSPEKTAVTRIRFKNSGTLSDTYFGEISLIDSLTKEVFAKTGAPVDGVIDFVLKPDSSKTDNGLIVSGKLYAISATIATPNSALKPTIRLDIIRAEDVAARDFKDLSRVADISSQNTFPITGPMITLP